MAVLAARGRSITSTRRPFKRFFILFGFFFNDPRQTNWYRFQFVLLRGCKQRSSVLSADYTFRAYVYNNPDFSPLEKKPENSRFRSDYPSFRHTHIDVYSFPRILTSSNPLPPPSGTAHVACLIICSGKLLWLLLRGPYVPKSRFARTARKRATRHVLHVICRWPVVAISRRIFCDHRRLRRF